jgi:hypothetical protein
MHGNLSRWASRRAARTKAGRAPEDSAIGSPQGLTPGVFEDACSASSSTETTGSDASAGTSGQPGIGRVIFVRARCLASRALVSAVCGQRHDEHD